MKILLVDDHRLVADAMAIMLQDLAEEVDITICYTTQHALGVVDEGRDFDLILSDIYMPGIDGLGFLHGLKQRQVTSPIVIISSTENAKVAQAALDQGASGFIQKSLPGSEMLAALKKVLHGQKYQPRNLEAASTKPQAMKRASSSDSAALGPRQLEVLQLIAAGNSNKQIAQLMEISEATVKYHTSHIFRSFGVHNRTSCIREAQSRGLIENPVTDN